MSSEIRKQVGRGAPDGDRTKDALARVWQLRKSLLRLGAPRDERDRGARIIKQVGRTS
ncbi:MAG: hypothetical protein GXP31_15945 [Kiritimatiellaeota bacterium]|nr:hypothetical protein [Kiritimatiellota bacterium]